MNIIRKITRKFGFDLVRYSNGTSTAAEIRPARKNIPALISRERAEQVLKSVGRTTDTPAFTWYSRPQKSSQALDEAENLWWNAHGKLIEKVWVLSEKVNNEYRKTYVSEAESFFRDSNGKAKILDLGCGSGWFGRMIAGKGLEYYGMDFSSTQIEIANAEKEHAENREHLHYYCLTDFKKIENLNEITGVVIHAFLHHLYWEELHMLFRELVEVLPDGCKFFILEPVYEDPAATDPAMQDSLNAMILSHRNHLALIKKDCIANDEFDIETETTLNEIVEESSVNGFFFSPKEVPFRMKEFTEFLKNYVHVESVLPTGVLDIETAQFIEKIRPAQKREQLCSTLLPFVRSLDRILIANNYSAANTGTYLFTAFKCILNKS